MVLATKDEVSSLKPVLTKTVFPQQTVYTIYKKSTKSSKNGWKSEKSLLWWMKTDEWETVYMLLHIISMFQYTNK